MALVGYNNFVFINLKLAYYYYTSLLKFVLNTVAKSTIIFYKHNNSGIEWLELVKHRKAEKSWWRYTESTLKNCHGSTSKMDKNLNTRNVIDYIKVMGLWTALVVVVRVGGSFVLLVFFEHVLEYKLFTLSSKP